MALAWHGVRRGQPWARATSIAVVIIVLAVNVPIHHVTNLFSYDVVVHTGPGYLFAAGAVLAYPASKPPADRRIYQ